MTLDELDNLLDKWQRDIQVITQNLLAYEDSQSFSLAKTVLPSAQGPTKQLLEPAIQALEQIWYQFGTLNEVIKEATALRQSMPIAFGRQDRIKQIERLLTGSSVCLQIEEIPLEKRGLTGASHLTKMTTPADIFNSMQTKFMNATRDIALYEKTSQELEHKLAEIELDLNFKFGTESEDALVEVRNTLHSDPISGLEMWKKLKKPKPTRDYSRTFQAAKDLERAFSSPPPTETSPKLPELPPLESAGGSLYTFLSAKSSQKTESSTTHDSSSIAQFLAGAEDCKPKSDRINSKPESNQIGSLEKLITENETSDTSSLESLIQSPPPASTPPTKTPTQQLEDLFRS